MAARVRELRYYVTPAGRAPFREWLDQLKDPSAKARIQVRLDRSLLGNLGQARSLGGGIHEMKIGQGPGYRVYHGHDGPVIVILLCGGTKPTQKRDIRTARDYWRDYLRRGQ